MENAAEGSLRESKLAGWSRTLYLLFTAFWAALLLLLIFSNLPVINETHLIVLVAVLFVVAILRALNTAFRAGVRWDETGVRNIGTIWPRSICDWNNLTGITRNIRRRYTLLSFKNRQCVRVMWGCDAHNDIIDLAERKLNNA